MPEIQNYQGEIYVGGVKSGDKLEYSVWLEKASELVSEIEKIRQEIVRIAENETLAGTESDAFRTLREISEAASETQKLLKTGKLDDRRKERLQRALDRFKRLVEQSEQVQQIKALRGQIAVLVQKVKELIIYDRDKDLDLKHRKGFADKDV